MKFSIPFIITVLVVLSSCGEKLTEKVLSIHPTNTPSLIEYYKQVDSVEVLAKVTRFYFNGEKQEETFMNGKSKEGTRTLWYLSGDKQEESNYKDNVKHGSYTLWYENGEMQYEAEYNNGRPSGTWRYYALDGSLEQETKY